VVFCMSLVEIQHPNMPPHQGRETGFQKGHPRYGGRRKGTRNKVGGDLREAVVAGIAATGYIEKAEDGTLKATGRGGAQGFIEWLALHEPKTAAALFARVMPYFISVDGETPEEPRDSVAGSSLRSARCSAVASLAAASGATHWVAMGVTTGSPAIGCAHGAAGAEVERRRLYLANAAWPASAPYWRSRSRAIDQANPPTTRAPTPPWYPPPSRWRGKPQGLVRSPSVRPLEPEIGQRAGCRRRAAAREPGRAD
jgi:hypothetical protein